MAYKRSRKDFEADIQKEETPFAFYGTPLPALDDHSRDDGSYVPVWKQEVTDDRGRKRLHGAFTGGFSAGYFNTVGSKEGWAPATFVSSRTNRATNARSQTQQRPEDFMDEEDIREQEESKNLTASGGFTGFGTADDAMHQNKLMDLLQPTEDNMGIRLLNKMGWKLGHGIGPKIKRRVDSDGESGKLHLFAPGDIPILSLDEKTGYSGLGYNSGDTATGSTIKPATTRRAHTSSQFEEGEDADEDDGRPGLNFASHPKKVTKQKRSAFGVGVLNDTGSDDEDTYSMGPKISYNKTLGGDKRSKKSKPILVSNANPLLKNTPVFVPKKINPMSNALRKCHDGRLPLDGFVLADELDNFSIMSLNDDTYKPPVVPEGWKPVKTLLLDESTEQDTYQSTTEVARGSTHTSSTRGSLLGESALPGKSVFDYLTPAARDKLIKATGKTNLPPALGESLPGTTSTTQALEHQIPRLDSQIALQALTRLLGGGFTPYASDPGKAARYKAYLESQANSTTIPDSSTSPVSAPTKPVEVSTEDYIQELYEFARVAEVFKPVSGAIASRFTTSTSTSATAVSSPTPELLSNSAPIRPQDPAEEAAKMGMFGHLTRSSSNFYPTRLLCKRFGVPMPSHGEMPQNSSFSGGASTGAGATRSRFQSAGFQHNEEDEIPSQSGYEQGQSDSVGNESRGQLAIEAPRPDTRRDEGGRSAPVQTAAIDPDKNEALEQERPGAAVFRAIFGSDDSDNE